MQLNSDEMQRWQKFQNISNRVGIMIQIKRDVNCDQCMRDMIPDVLDFARQLKELTDDPTIYRDAKTVELYRSHLDHAVERINALDNSPKLAAEVEAGIDFLYAFLRAIS